MSVISVRSFLPVLVGIALGVTACESEPVDDSNTKAAKGLQVLTQGTEAAGEAPPPAEEPPPPPPPPAAAAEGAAEGDLAYAYSAIGKRDPFRSPLEEFNREDLGVPVTELQRFEIDQLKLVAIVSRVATPYAMVEDPTSKGHTLTRGTLIGKNWGKVSQITGTCVEVKEDYRDYTGRKQSNKLELCLPKPPELKLD
jgi:type IV pilus assembly protein PilP